MTHPRRPTLWNKNFTIITLGTVVSAIGGVAIQFALGFVIFDNTQSTLASGTFLALSSLPSILLPVLLAPYLDAFPRKPVVVGLDAVSGGLYLAFGGWLCGHGFSYGLYLGFSLVTGCIGAVYNLAYNSLYPNLIPDGFMQKGYTVSGMIYPTVTMCMTPLASVLYKRLGMGPICLAEGGLLLAAAALESRIRVREQPRAAGRFSLRAYLADMRAAFAYLKKEKGLRRIYSYMPITQGISEATDPLVRAWFVTTPGLDITMYALFTTAQFVGRTLGGLLQYKVEIPTGKRFSFSYFVYTVYNLMDAVLLWLGYPWMLLNRGVCGFLGINSAVLRESSVQSYLPDGMRAKINAVFNTVYALVPAVLTVLLGALGEVLDYRLCVTLFAGLAQLACHLILWRGRAAVRPVYDRAPQQADTAG